MSDWVVVRAASGKLALRKREMVLGVILWLLRRIVWAWPSGKCKMVGRRAWRRSQEVAL